MPYDLPIARVGLLLAIALVLCLEGGPARAEDRVDFDASVSVPLLVGEVGGMVAIDKLKPALAPDSCRWCDRRADGADRLNGLDAAARRGLLWRDTEKADELSDALVYGALPVSVAGLNLASAHRGVRVGHDVLIVGEAALLSAVLNHAVKYAVGRQRPCAHFGVNCGYGDRRDENLSFYSGHASFSFAIATSAATVANLRGYRAENAVWITGLSLAAVTSYLRVAADRHYLTDVIVGALVGSAVGIGVPRLLHQEGDAGSEGENPLIVVFIRF